MATTIRIEENTKLRLVKHGIYCDTMDEIVNKVLDKAENKVEKA
jgi:hypothetical protein